MMQTKLKKVATEEELKMLTISFTRQAIGLDYTDYNNLVNVITVLDVMGEKFEVVDQVKQELLDRIQTSYIGGVR